MKEREHFKKLDFLVFDRNCIADDSASNLCVAMNEKR